ncbi:MAG: hypothetical protein RMK01_03525 [Thermomicrobium sp.]|nr:hypothetical protein [Thermomicrobium sp.]
MQPFMTRRAMLATSLAVAAGAVAFGFWQGVRSRAEVEQPPALSPLLSEDEAARARTLAQQHPTVQALLGSGARSDSSVQVSPLAGPDGRIVGAGVWFPFDAPRTVRATWMHPTDWQVNWPPTRFVQASYTVQDADGILVWVDLASGQVVRVEASGPYARVAPGEDPFVLRGELRERAIRLALDAPWLTALLAAAKPSVMEHLPGAYDRRGDLIGGIVGLQFPEPIDASGTFPFVEKPEYGSWEEAQIVDRTLHQKVTLIVVVVSFREDRALGIWYYE